MESELRRVAGIILGAPLTRRTRRDLLYCLTGGLAGVGGFVVTAVLLMFGFTVSASIIGTVVGLLLITVELRVSRRLGSLHRRLLRRFLGHRVEAPSRFQPGTGVLGRLDRRLRDRAAWRGVWYSLIKLPVAGVQLYAITLTIFGLVDITYPVDWLFRNHPAGTGLSPLMAVVPLPFVGSLSVSSWLGTYVAALAGALCVVIAAWLARGISAADYALARGLLGPSTMAERVSELERTRTLAVEDSAAALRRVERDLHDGAQMRLAALAMNLGMAREKLDVDDDATVRELIDAAHRNAVDALSDLRDLARGIHPPVLDNGLASALDSLAAS
ncbi:MAG: sensor domain-containing protein, partial [Streptosporangiaceae bacterium]